jgi:hypothetical protein
VDFIKAQAHAAKEDDKKLVVLMLITLITLITLTALITPPVIGVDAPCPHVPKLVEPGARGQYDRERVLFVPRVPDELRGKELQNQLNPHLGLWVPL